MMVSEDAQRRPRGMTALAAEHIRIVLFGGVQASLNRECGDLEVVLCEDAAGLRTLLDGASPAVLFVDLASLTPADTAELLKIIERVNVLPVAFSDACEDIEGERLLRAGYAGLLPRDAPAETVMRAVRAIADGQLWFSRRTISRVLTTFLFQEDLNRLTSREIEILMLIGSGLSNQEIGNKLFISRETVRWHVRGLYSKLGIVNRLDALEYLRSLHGSGTRIGAKSEGAKNTWSRAAR